MEASTQASLLKFYKTRLPNLQASDLCLDLVDTTLVFDNTLENKNSNPIMIIGEAPGRNEVEQKKPFVGMAGRNLTETIKRAGLSREKDFLITNAFPFRTFEYTAKGVKNRTPNTSELTFGAKLLLEEISVVQPKLILLLGGSAKKAFLKVDDENVREVVKGAKNHSIVDCYFSSIGLETKVGLTFHPSPLVYNTKQKRERLQDFFLTLKF